MKSEMMVWIQKNAKTAKDRESFIQECVDKFHKEHRRVGNILSEMRRNGDLPANCLVGSIGKRLTIPKSVSKPTNGRPFRMSIDVTEVKKEYDDEKKIQEGLKALGTHLIKDNDFRLELGVSFERWKIVSALPRFANNRCELKGKRFRGLYWGEASIIRDLRKKIDLL